MLPRLRSLGILCLDVYPGRVRADIGPLGSFPLGLLRLRCVQVAKLRAFLRLFSRIDVLFVACTEALAADVYARTAPRAAPARADTRDLSQLAAVDDFAYAAECRVEAAGRTRWRRISLEFGGITDDS